MEAEKRREITEFIRRRFPGDSGWKTGNCLYFAKILADRFPELSVYYVPDRFHFVAGDGEDFFDHGGRCRLAEWERAEELERIRKESPGKYEKILREYWR